MNIYEAFLMFIIYASIGWLIEVVSIYIKKGKLVNRGFLIGPYCPIYGVGGLLITLFLTKYKENPVTLFVMAVFICGVLEYLTSYLMEKLFNARWWDYSYRKFHINGRVCLETLSAFGALGLVVIYLLNPIMFDFFDFLTPTPLKIISIILAIIFIADLSVSFEIISGFKNTAKSFKNKDNTEEITKKVKEILYKKSPLSKRLIEAFPDVKTVIINIKNELRRTKTELRSVKKDLRKTERKLRKAERKLNK